MMNKLVVSLLAGAGALVAGSAQAAPLSPVAPALDNGIENVRMVCDEYGRCWRERGPRRVIIERDSYNYVEPRYGYRRHHSSATGRAFQRAGREHRRRRRTPLVTM